MAVKDIFSCMQKKWGREKEREEREREREREDSITFSTV